MLNAKLLVEEFKEMKLDKEELAITLSFFTDEKDMPLVVSDMSAKDGSLVIKGKNEEGCAYTLVVDEASLIKFAVFVDK